MHNCYKINKAKMVETSNGETAKVCGIDGLDHIVLVPNRKIRGLRYYDAINLNERAFMCQLRGDTEAFNWLASMARAHDVPHNMTV